MFRFIETVFIVEISLFHALKCISMNNQGYNVKPEIININSNEPSFYPYSFNISKFTGSCNNINDPYANICVPDFSKNMNVKVFNLISRTKYKIHKMVWNMWVQM